MTIRHKEFVATISGSTGFSVQRFFLLQPGDTNTFPWLSGVASKFQQYRVKGMIFHYVPTSGYAVSGSNPAIGSVMLQTSYRANDNAPSTKIEMLNEYWASEGAPSEAFCHPIECSPKENPFVTHYVRNRPVPVSDSPMLYDLGVTYVATQGMPATGNAVGDLWVTYEIELVKPQIASSVLIDTFSGTAANAAVLQGAPLGNNLTATGSLLFSMSNSTITFPIGLLGDFLVTVIHTGTFTVWDGPTSATSLANCALLVFDGSRSVVSPDMASGSCNIFTTSYGIRLSDPSAVASFNVGAFLWTASGNVDVKCVITQIA